MTADTWFVLKVMCGALAGLFGVAATVAGFSDVRAGDDQSRAQAWFEARWTALDGSGWLSLPERVLSSALRLKSRVGELPGVLFHWGIETPAGVAIVGIGAPIVCAVSCATAWGWIAGMVGALLTAPFALIWRRAAIHGPPHADAVGRLLQRAGRRLDSSCVGTLSLLLVVLGTPILVTYSAHRLGLVYGGALMLLALPVYAWLRS